MIYTALTFSHDTELVQCFKDRNGKIVIFPDAVTMIQSIGATHTLTRYSLHAQESSKKIRLGSEIEASIRDSFSTILSSIIVGNKNETTGSAYECLVRYMKYYSIFIPV